MYVSHLKIYVHHNIGELEKMGAKHITRATTKKLCHNPIRNPFANAVA